MSGADRPKPSNTPLQWGLVILVGVCLVLWTFAAALAQVPVAHCPKVEVRVTLRRGVEVRDTITRIPEVCRAP